MKWPMNEGKKKKKMDFAVRVREYTPYPIDPIICYLFP